MLDDRIERAVGMIGRAPVGDPDMLFARDAFTQRFHQPRLSNPCFPLNQYRLSVPLFARLPGAQQQAQLFLAADERRLGANAFCFIAAADVPLAHDAPGPHRIRDALERMDAEIVVLEERAQQLMRRRRYHDLAGSGQALQSGRQVRCLAHHGGFFGCPFADDVADDHRSGGDADARLQHHGVWFADTGTQGLHGCDDLEPRSRRALGVVLVGLGVAEIGEHAVAHVARHVSVEMFDSRLAGVLIGAIDVAKVLGVESLRQLGRAHEITEHHRQLPVLGVGSRRRRTCFRLAFTGRRSGRRPIVLQRSDGLQ